MVCRFTILYPIGKNMLRDELFAGSHNDVMIEIDEFHHKTIGDDKPMFFVSALVHTENFNGVIRYKVIKIENVIGEDGDITLSPEDHKIFADAFHDQITDNMIYKALGLLY